DDAGAVEHVPPVIGGRQPQEQAGEQRRAQVLTTNIDTAGHATLARREPDGDRTAVGRERRRFHGAYRQPQTEQRGKATCHALAYRDRRP
nr:hypothetical protein [Tanacetum cinerariifolium]